MRAVLVSFVILATFVALTPPASADEEICPLKNTESEHHCIWVTEGPFGGTAICVVEWNVQHTHGQGRCVIAPVAE